MKKTVKKPAKKRKTVVKRFVNLTSKIAHAIKTVKPITDVLIPIVEKAVVGTPYALAIGTGVGILKMLEHTDVAQAAIKILIAKTKDVTSAQPMEVEKEIKKALNEADDTITFTPIYDKPKLVPAGRFVTEDRVKTRPKKATSKVEVKWNKPEHSRAISGKKHEYEASPFRGRSKRKRYIK